MLNLIESHWLFFVILAMIIAALLLARMYSGPARLPYRARGRIMTNVEAKFFRSLQQAVHGDFLIFTMVRLADLLRVADEASNKRMWFNRIVAKHVDFVLCDVGSLQPLLAIELDDASHERADRQERDKFLEDAFEGAGLPLLRIKIAADYDLNMLRKLIDDRVRK